MSTFGAIVLGVLIILVGLFFAVKILFWIGVIVAVIGVLYFIFNGPMFPGRRNRL